MSEEKIKKLQDFESDWYWIPKSKVSEFEEMNAKLCEIEDYMDDPDLFDQFEELFGHYKTGGDKNNMPRHFQKNTF